MIANNFIGGFFSFHFISDYPFSFPRNYFSTAWVVSMLFLFPVYFILLDLSINKYQVTFANANLFFIHFFICNSHLVYFLSVFLFCSFVHSFNHVFVHLFIRSFCLLFYVLFFFNFYLRFFTFLGLSFEKEVEK